MSTSVPPPPGPDDAIVTPGLKNPAPEVEPTTPFASSGATNAGASEPITSFDRADAAIEAVVGSAATDARQSGRPEPRAADVHPLIPAVSLGITAIHLVMTVIGVVLDADAVRNGVAAISVALFFVGAVSFIVAFVLAAGRSRYEDLWFGGAFFLTGGVVPARARTVLMGCLAAQCVVGLVGASVAPFTPVAFVVLVPLAAMGLMSLYGARWGEFSTKSERD